MTKINDVPPDTESSAEMRDVMTTNNASYFPQWIQNNNHNLTHDTLRIILFFNKCPNNQIEDLS